jgi:hypothetical protein
MEMLSRETLHWAELDMDLEVQEIPHTHTEVEAGAQEVLAELVLMELVVAMEELAVKIVLMEQIFFGQVVAEEAVGAHLVVLEATEEAAGEQELLLALEALA